MTFKKTPILTIANQKGGVGKTTCVVNLASAYAKQNKKVLVIDLDKQANTTSHLGVIEASKEQKKYVYDAIISETEKIEDYVLQTKFKNIDCLAADERLNDINEKFSGRPNRCQLLNLICSSEVLVRYDLVVLDTSPTFDALSQSALAASSHYLIPVFPEAHCLQGLGTQIKNSNSIIKYQNKTLSLLGCIVTQYDKRNATHRKIESNLRKMAKASSFSIFTSVIPTSKSVSSAASNETPIHFFRTTSPIAKAYTNLANEISLRIEEKPSSKNNLPDEKIINNTDSQLFDTEEITF